jgi:hypothetical protein
MIWSPQTATRVAVVLALAMTLIVLFAAFKDPTHRLDGCQRLVLTQSGHECG